VSNKKIPPITQADIARGAADIQKAVMEQARHVEEVGGLVIAIDLHKAISLITTSRYARRVGDECGAEERLDDARDLMLRLLGIETETDAVESDS
jgi:hypothetical protein